MQPNTDAKRIQLISVIEHGGTVWQVGQPVPGSQDTKIMKLFLIDGLVEIFALPLPGTELDKMQQGLHFTLMPLSIKLVTGVARFDAWQMILKETEESLDADDDEDDDEEDEEDDQPPFPNVPAFTPQQQPAAGVPAPLPGGFAAVTQQPQQPPAAIAAAAQSNPQPSYVPQLTPSPETPNGQTS